MNVQDSELLSRFAAFAVYPRTSATLSRGEKSRYYYRACQQLRETVPEGQYLDACAVAAFFSCINRIVSATGHQMEPRTRVMMSLLPYIAYLVRYGKSALMIICALVLVYLFNGNFSSFFLYTSMLLLLRSLV